MTEACDRTSGSLGPRGGGDWGGGVVAKQKLEKASERARERARERWVVWGSSRAR